MFLICQAFLPMQIDLSKHVNLHQLLYSKSHIIIQKKLNMTIF